ncbi:MAG: NADP-dependent oxidoreductase [Rubrivivax sp.]
MKNQRIVLASRPAGDAEAANFRLEEVDLPALTEGQVLVRQQFLSLDPYMRGRMNDSKSYAVPQAIDAVMGGGTVGEVVESKHAGFKNGDAVVGMGGWQTHAIIDAGTPGALRKVATERVPLSAYLGAVGMPGVTAWYGLNRVIQPKSGGTVVVDAASGAVGSVVGQLAKAHGCRVVGLAGGPDKCGYVVDELGFDACIDYKAHRGFDSLAEALDKAAPDGVDGLFENVGGLIFNAVLSRMNAFGRIALCGLISGYDGEPTPIDNPRLFLTQRLMLQGFIVSEHMEVWPEALQDLGQRVASGKLKFRESIAEGLPAAPEAFLGLLKGRNFGKQLVKLS